MRKKIALQFFGNIRTFKNCVKSLDKNIFDIYDCDIFMHTWDTIDHATQTWHKHQIKQDQKNTVSEEIIKKHYPLLKKIEIESPQDMKFNLEGEFSMNDKKFSLQGVRCMYHSMERSNTLRQEYEKENNIKYDYVILMRPDLRLNKPLILENYTQVKGLDHSNSIYTSQLASNNLITNDEKALKGIDLIIFSTPENMDRLFKVNNLNKHITEVKDKNVASGPEQFVCNLAKDNNLNLKVTNYTTANSFDIIRKTNLLSLKNIISLRIKKDLVTLSILPKVNNLLSLSLNLFNDEFKVQISIGKAKL
jgi:hypothetical protein